MSNNKRRVPIWADIAWWLGLISMGFVPLSEQTMFVIPLAIMLTGIWIAVRFRE